MRVIDFFCGAGGFSEGFRQQGFKIVMGIDNWSPAVQTHNINHGLNDEIIDILQFEESLEKIYALPDTEVIIGSPPCVTFSMSNKAGKADKSLGIRLIEAYLRVVAVKKHQKNSILVAWLMENVPNSRNFVNEIYTFNDLNLSEWAKENNKDPMDVALKVKNSGGLYTASDYGSPQARQRFICGEVVSTGEFPEPIKTHGSSSDTNGLIPYLSLGDIKNRMPSPYYNTQKGLATDPNYPHLSLKNTCLTDHFYDTGIYQVEWLKAKDAKMNHPYMGKMSFPEDETRPSRTIMATRSASTREAIIFKSDLNRVGDGEYRLPTIREAASLMGFPYSYQFTGGEGTKWRLIGNAVCPHMAAALAKAINISIGIKPVPFEKIQFNEPIKPANNNNLNNPEPRSFDSPPKKKIGAKFRGHPFKTGNMTIGLTNYDPQVGNDPLTNGTRWYCTIFLGSGRNYTVAPVTDTILKSVRESIDEEIVSKFLNEINKQILDKTLPSKKLQKVLEENKISKDGFYDPRSLIQQIAKLIEKYDLDNKMVDKVELNGIQKDIFPFRQLLAILAISMVVNKANQHA